MPFVNLPYIRHMKKLILNAEKEISVVLSIKNGYYEPLNAFYSRKLIPLLQTQLHANKNKISDCYSENDKIEITESIQAEFDPHELMFINLNTPKDIEELHSKQMLL